MKTLALRFSPKKLRRCLFQLNRNYCGFELDSEFDYSIPEDHPLVKMMNLQNMCLTIDDIKKNIEPDSPIESLIALQAIFDRSAQGKKSYQRTPASWRTDNLGAIFRI